MYSKFYRRIGADRFFSKRVALEHLPQSVEASHSDQSKTGGRGTVCSCPVQTMFPGSAVCLHEYICSGILTVYNVFWKIHISINRQVRDTYEEDEDTHPGDCRDRGPGGHIRSNLGEKI